MNKKLLPLFLSTLFSFPIFGINSAFAMLENPNENLNKNPNVERLVVEREPLPGEDANLRGRLNLDDLNHEGDRNPNGEGDDYIEGNQLKKSLIRRLGEIVKNNPIKTGLFVGGPLAAITTISAYYLVNSNDGDVDDVDTVDTNGEKMIEDRESDIYNNLGE